MATSEAIEQVDDAVEPDEQDDVVEPEHEFTADGRRIVKLNDPIKLGKKRVIDELHFRRGKFGDLKGIKLSGTEVSIDDVIQVAARMCGEPTTVIERLGEDDSGEVFAIAMGFIGRSLSTGSMRSAS